MPLRIRINESSVPMASAPQPELFLDTSIQIARHVHGPKTKVAIKQRLSQHSKHITSLVVRQEFKRRLLKEAEYLLRLLYRYQSFDEVNQHVIRLFGQWPGRVRKRNIYLQMLSQVHAGSDGERTERLQLYLRSLLVSGLRRFDQMVDEIRRDSNCACALQVVIEKQKLRRYELGTDKCSRTKPGTCGIQEFLKQRADLSKKILEYFQALASEKKSKEIQNAEKFLAKILAKLEKADEEDPCLTVGDLLIALESAGVSHFFTVNGIESQHYCRPLGQTMIVHPIDPLKAEIICPIQDAQWPEFGAGSGE
jgi:hypothetical protein